MNEMLKPEMFKPSVGSAAGVDRVMLDPSATTSAAAAPPVRAHHVAPVTPDKNAENVQNAVYGHIRAVRALGRTEILPSEIATALGLTTVQVMEALTALQGKGVKFNK